LIVQQAVATIKCVMTTLLARSWTKSKILKLKTTVDLTLNAGLLAALTNHANPIACASFTFGRLSL